MAARPGRVGCTSRANAAQRWCGSSARCGAVGGQLARVERDQRPGEPFGAHAQDAEERAVRALDRGVGAVDELEAGLGDGDLPCAPVVNRPAPAMRSPAWIGDPRRSSSRRASTAPVSLTGTAVPTPAVERRSCADAGRCVETRPSRPATVAQYRDPHSFHSGALGQVRAGRGERDRFFDVVHGRGCVHERACARRTGGRCAGRFRPRYRRVRALSEPARRRSARTGGSLRRAARPGIRARRRE